MNSLLKLFEKDLINTEKLVMETYKSIGLTSSQALIIIKVLNNKKYKFTVSEISKDLNVSEKQIERIVNKILKKKYITTEFKKGEEPIFNIKPLIIRMLQLFDEPSAKDSNEKKNAWFHKAINFKKTKTSESDVNKWLEDGNWNTLKKIVDKLTKLEIKVKTWHTIKEIYKIETNEKGSSSKKLEKLIKVNWLED